MIVLWVALTVVGLAAAVRASSRGVDHAAKAALGLNLPPFAVGFTLVAVGTDLPEIANSVTASIAGFGDVNAGDSIGSAAAQASLVIGLAPFLARRGTIVNRREVLVLAGLAVAVLLLGAGLMADGDLGRGDGVALVLSWALAVTAAWRWTSPPAQPELPLREQRAWVHAAKAIGWLVLVLVAATAAVYGLTETATALAFPQYLVSFFGLAIGTSLPELVVVVAALRDGHGELALGDALGATLADASLSIGIGPIVAPTLVTAGLAVRAGLVTAALVGLVGLVLAAVGRHNRFTGVAAIALYVGAIPLLVG